MTFEELLRQAMESLQGTDIYAEPKKLRDALREMAEGDKSLRAEAEDFADGIKEIAKLLPRIKDKVDLVTLISEGREEEAIAAYPEIADRVARKDYLGYIALMQMASRAAEEVAAGFGKEDATDDDLILPEEAEDEAEEVVDLPPASPRKNIFADLVKEHRKSFIAMILFIAVTVIWILTSILFLHGTGKGARHAIGAVGGVIMTIWVWAMSAGFNKRSTDKPHLVISWILLLINAALGFTQGAIYLIVGYWACGFILASALLSLIASFDDSGKGWSLSNLAEVLCAIAVIVAFSRIGKGGWSQFQHIIGSFGGVLLVIFLWTILTSINEKKSMIYHTFCAMILLAVNAVLYAWLRDSYRIIAIWMAGFMIFSCFWTITHYEEKISLVWGSLSILEALLYAMCIGVFAVYGRGPWTTCQHLIGAFGGMTLVLVMIVMDLACTDAGNERKGEILLRVVWILFALGNGALAYFYRANYFVIGYWLSGYLLAVEGLFAVLNATHKRWGPFVLSFLYILIGVAGIVVPAVIL